MLFSVVIPCFDSEATIERAVGSVLSQTHQDLEVVVVDDGSTDGTGDLVLRLAAADEAARGAGGGRVRLIRQENRGPGPARNAGLREARGDAIAFLDADDHWMPRYLERVAWALEQFPYAGAVATDFLEVHGHRVRPAQRRGRREQARMVPDYFRARMDRTLASATSSVVIRRSVAEQVGPIREDLGLYGEEQEYWARITARGVRWALLPEPLVLIDMTTYPSLTRGLSDFGQVRPPDEWSAHIWPLLGSEWEKSFTDYYLWRTKRYCVMCLRFGPGSAAKTAACRALRRAGGPLTRLELRAIILLPAGVAGLPFKVRSSLRALLLGDGVRRRTKR